jgi:hypothetical protein
MTDDRYRQALKFVADRRYNTAEAHTLAPGLVRPDLVGRYAFHEPYQNARAALAAIDQDLAPLAQQGEPK